MQLLHLRQVPQTVQRIITSLALLVATMVGAPSTAHAFIHCIPSGEVDATVVDDVPLAEVGLATNYGVIAVEQD
ncbi:MAG: hypothetical protein AAF602_08465, partial [Myxococcota bacterium]